MFDDVKAYTKMCHLFWATLYFLNAMTEQKNHHDMIALRSSDSNCALVFSSTAVSHSSYYTVRLASQIRQLMVIVNICHIFYLFNITTTDASVRAKSPSLVNASKL